MFASKQTMPYTHLAAVLVARRASLHVGGSPHVQQAQKSMWTLVTVKPTLTTPAGRSAPRRWPTQDGVVLFSHKTCAQSRPRRHRNIIQVHAFQLRLCHGAVTTQARQTTSVLARHARRQRHRSVSRRCSVIPSSSVIRLRCCCCCGCLLLVAGQRGVWFLQKARNNASNSCRESLEMSQIVS